MITTPDPPKEGTATEGFRSTRKEALDFDSRGFNQPRCLARVYGRKACPSVCTAGVLGLWFRVIGFRVIGFRPQSVGLSVQGGAEKLDGRIAS